MFDVEKIKYVNTGIPKEDLSGMTFGDWKVISEDTYSDKSGKKKRRWLCECICGEKRSVLQASLKSGKSTGCGCNRKKIDLVGKRFGEWEVIDKAKSGKNGETMFLCKCSCGIEKEVSSKQLRSGKSKSCGHGSTGFIDLTGKSFGRWEVIKRASEKGKRVYWICKCRCGNIKIVDGYVLRSGKSKSCGCITEELRVETNEKKYGIGFVSQIGTKRTEEQLLMVRSKENLLRAIEYNFRGKPSITELAKVLGLDRASTLMQVRRKELEDKVEIGLCGSSGYERELKGLYEEFDAGNRKELAGVEIDLYNSSKKLGIEFNGNYWHSDLNKDKRYHQNKTKLARSKGIDLIHIFEYEWLDEEKKDKLVNLINRRIGKGEWTRIYARDCKIEEIDKNVANEFIHMYHLQGSCNADINIGLYLRDKLIGVMTFSKPRFDRKYDFEMIRLCWKEDVYVVGGAERLFNYFIKQYKASSILTYSDLSKFNGSVYKRLGFREIGITEPNYVWVSMDGVEVLSRYKTMKGRLLKAGLGKYGSTEDEILRNLGYLKVYDCGNLKLEWNRSNFGI